MFSNLCLDHGRLYPALQTRNLIFVLDPTAWQVSIERQGRRGKGRKKLLKSDQNSQILARAETSKVTPHAAPSCRTLTARRPSRPSSVSETRLFTSQRELLSAKDRASFSLSSAVWEMQWVRTQRPQTLNVFTQIQMFMSNVSPFALFFF